MSNNTILGLCAFVLIVIYTWVDWRQHGRPKPIVVVFWSTMLGLIAGGVVANLFVP